VSFHCQQAAEKYLKAWLQENGLPLPKTHDLEKLLDDLLPHDATLGVFRAGLVRLTRYAVDYRYPGIHATSAQAQSAVRFAARFRDAIRQRLNIRSRPRKKTT
jgi:HEPN domain-containing protein